MRTPARPMLLSFVLAACGGDEAEVVPPRAPQAPASAPAQAAAASPAEPDPQDVAKTAMSIGAPMTSADLARAVLMLTQAVDRSGLTAISADGVMFQLVLPPGVDSTRATALARALGSVTTQPIAWPSPTPTYGIELLSVRGGGQLMPTPTAVGTPVATLPDGAFFIGFIGAFAGGPSTREGENTWVYGHDTAGHAAWIKSSSLAPEEGCVLSKDVIAGALSLRLDDPRLALMTFGNMPLHRGGRAKRGSFLVTDSFVAVVDRAANCRTATLDTFIDAAGSIEAFHHARATESGDTFLAIAYYGEDGNDESRWAFYPPRATEPSVEMSVPTNWAIPTRRRGTVRFGVRRGPERARGYWAFSVTLPGAEPLYYTFFDGAFVEFGAAPAPTPAPTEGAMAAPTEGATASP